MVLDGNAVRSVDRAAALLLALGESQGEAGVTELARRLGLHKSTASRLLATLQKRGLVEQDDETGKYRLGLVVIRLAERAERTLDLRGIALGRDADRAAAGVDAVPGRLDGAGEAAVDRIVAQQVGVGFDRAEVVDRHHLDVGRGPLHPVTCADHGICLRSD